MAVGGRIIDTALHRVRADAASWRLSERGAVLLAATPIVGIAFLAALLPLSSLFVFLTREDSVLEWLQIGLLAVAAGGFVRVVYLAARQHRWALAVVLFVGGLGAAFVAGEEVSWGQRLFGWTLPEPFATLNNQSGTSAEGFRLIQRIFGLLQLALGAYGTIVPAVAVLRGIRPRDTLALLIPPFCLIPAFAPSFLYRTLRSTVMQDVGFRLNLFGEGPELALYFGLAVMSWLIARRLASGHHRLSARPSG